MKYDVTDEISITANNVAVFNAVIDAYDGKNNWWTPYHSSTIIEEKSISEIGSECKVKIHAIIPISFITKTVETKPNEMLQVHYIRGSFKGEGIWEFKQTGNTTKVSFRWLTSPNNNLIKAIAPFVSISKNHSAVMQKGFKNLKKMLE